MNGSYVSLPLNQCWEPDGQLEYPVNESVTSICQAFKLRKKKIEEKINKSYLYKIRCINMQIEQQKQ